MNTARGILSTVRRLVTVIAIAIVFVFGLGTTVYLSLRSPEVKVPDVMGKDRFEAERVLGDAGLNFRVRKYRPTGEMKADTVLFQVPKGGEVVKAGQTVAMDLSRPVKEGETPDVVAPEATPEEKPANQNANSENDNKPKHNRNTNKNANDNTNSNNGNRNTNANASRLTTNRNTNTGNMNSNANANANVNRPLTNPGNANRAVNQNGNVRPPVARPLPTPKPTNPNR